MSNKRRPSKPQMPTPKAPLFDATAALADGAKITSVGQGGGGGSATPEAREYAETRKERIDEALGPLPLSDYDGIDVDEPKGGPTPYLTVAGKLTGEARARAVAFSGDLRAYLDGLPHLDRLGRKCSGDLDDRDACPTCNRMVRVLEAVFADEVSHG